MRPLVNHWFPPLSLMPRAVWLPAVPTPLTHASCCMTTSRPAAAATQTRVTVSNYGTLQADHSPDNVKFPDNSTRFPWQFAALLPMLTVTHIMPVLVLLSVVGGLECNSAWSKTKMKCTNSAKSRMDAYMELKINSFRQLFPDKIFSPDF